MKKNQLPDHPFIFLSASYPELLERHPNERYVRSADAHEITDAVVSCIDAVFHAGARLVFGGHPTISPLALRQAMGFFDHIDDGQKPMVIYQSDFFEAVIPIATRMIEQSHFGELKVTAKVEAGPDREASRAASLREMRERMLMETQPIAAIFIGGMEGVEDEYELCRELVPDSIRYLIGAPGGAAQRLLEDNPAVSHHANDELNRILSKSTAYPYVMAKILDHLNKVRTLPSY